ncbi:hypothetical protein BGZ57DRAFT_116238 [Hyaloscypha finlandica]|nr:hypothetical protein BGZ57DRAFT_116238 [Hyaloscypha finlandica]
MSSTTANSEISPFLILLPRETRLQIYSELLSSHTIPLCLANTGGSLAVPRDLLDLNLLSLPLTCHQIYNETIEILYSTNTYTLKTPTALRLFSHLSQPAFLLRSLNFTFPLPHLLYFSELPHTLPTSATDDSKEPLQRQDIAWIENWEILNGMKGLRKLRVELDVPVFWRHSWRAREGEMLAWLKRSGLAVQDFTLAVLWDEETGEEGRRERFGEGKRWKVERIVRKGEEGNIWERDWGHLVDLGMSG